MSEFPLSVTLAEIDKQRAKGWVDFHPEDFCHRCGGRNVASWSVDSDRFNTAMGGPGVPHRWNGIICPGCFVALHEEATGLRTTWQLIPCATTPFVHIAEVPEWNLRNPGMSPPTFTTEPTGG